MSKNLYIRADSDNGVLTNEDDIKYYKATQDIEIISNYLLGNFNNDGEYIIDNEIIEELVEMPKGVTNEFSNMIFCVSKVVTEYIEVEKFVVKTRYDEEDPSIKISTLEVLEDVKKVDGYFVNSLSTPIAEFVDIVSENYKEKMFEAFNIIDKEQYSVSQSEKFAHGKVSLRRKYVASIQKICEPQLNEVHKQAYQTKLEILKKSGQIGSDALKLFEDRLKDKPTIATKNNYKALNELLDSVIDVHKDKLKPIMPQIRAVGVEVAEKVEQIQKLSFQNLKNMQKTAQGLKAIQTQQDAVFNNKIVTKPQIKQIITEEVKKTDYDKANEAKNKLTSEIESKPVKKERVNILRNLFGMGNNEKRNEATNTTNTPTNANNTNITSNANATTERGGRSGYSEIVGRGRRYNNQQKDREQTVKQPEQAEVITESKPVNKSPVEKPQQSTVKENVVKEDKKQEKDNNTGFSFESLTIDDFVVQKNEPVIKEPISKEQTKETDNESKQERPSNSSTDNKGYDEGEFNLLNALLQIKNQAEEQQEKSNFENEIKELNEEINEQMFNNATRSLENLSQNGKNLKTIEEQDIGNER